MGWNIYGKVKANYWARNTSITNNTILSHRGPGILIDNSEDLTIIKNNKITVQTPKQYTGNGIMVSKVDVKILRI